MNENKKLMSGIKSKLLAAVCMLLVAVIMVVSSTYAWFTLSTAPEVTGIKTAVGANGALEMLLLQGKDESGNWIYKDSPVLEDENANNYWGNLVDVSEGYGLDTIMLYPSKLTTTTEGEIIKKGSVFASTGFLSMSVYDETGRVTELSNKTDTGVFDKANGFTINDGYGVRAIGVSSGMTQREFAYKNAKSTAKSLTSQANQIAGTSLDMYGSDLASIAVKYALNDSAKYEPTEIIPLLRITEALLADDGPLELIEEAYMNYIVAIFASQKAGDVEEAYSVVQGYMNTAIKNEKLMEEDGSNTPAITSFLTSLQGGAQTIGIPIDFPEGFEAKYITPLQETIDNVQSAYTSLSTLVASTDPLEWTQISAAVSVLVDTQYLKVNDLSINDVQTDKGKLISKYLETGKIIVSMQTGAGVYADIADHCGDYNTGVMITGIEYDPITPDMEIPAIMEAKTTENPEKLMALKNLFESDEYGAPTSATETVKTMTEFYGYIIDLAFRTNAASSNLLLQTDPIDRIYKDNQNELTAGNGSSMTFKSGADGFTSEDVANLMSNLRIIFFQETETGNEILATAKLNVYSTAADGTSVNEYEVGSDGVTAKMYLYETADDGTEKILEGTDAVIRGLNQNDAHNVHVLVYLDGEEITNADVAATGTSSMTGKMNLQFASSAALVPMDYADLHQTGGSTSEETTTPTEELEYDIAGPQNLTIESEYVNEAYSYTFSDTTWSISNGTISIPSNVTAGTEVTLTIKNADSEEVVKYIITVIDSATTGS